MLHIAGQTAGPIGLNVLWTLIFFKFFLQARMGPSASFFFKCTHANPILNLCYLPTTIEMEYVFKT